MQDEIDRILRPSMCDRFCTLDLLQSWDDDIPSSFARLTGIPVPEAARHHDWDTGCLWEVRGSDADGCRTILQAGFCRILQYAVRAVLGTYQPPTLPRLAVDALLHGNGRSMRHPELFDGTVEAILTLAEDTGEVDLDLCIAATRLFVPIREDDVDCPTRAVDLSEVEVWIGSWHPSDTGAAAASDLALISQVARRKDMAVWQVANIAHEITEERS